MVEEAVRVSEQFPTAEDIEATYGRHEARLTTPEGVGAPSSLRQQKVSNPVPVPVPRSKPNPNQLTTPNDGGTTAPPMDARSRALCQRLYGWVSPYSVESNMKG